MPTTKPHEPSASSQLWQPALDAAEWPAERRTMDEAEFAKFLAADGRGGGEGKEDGASDGAGSGGAGAGGADGGDAKQKGAAKVAEKEAQRARMEAETARLRALQEKAAELIHSMM